jgi:hypothetical protein
MKKPSFDNGFFVETATETPVEEAAGFAPAEGLADRAFSFHAASAVVEVCKLVEICE